MVASPCVCYLSHKNDERRGAPTQQLGYSACVRAQRSSTVCTHTKQEARIADWSRVWKKNAHSRADHLQIDHDLLYLTDISGHIYIIYIPGIYIYLCCWSVRPNSHCWVRALQPAVYSQVNPLRVKTAVPFRGQTSPILSGLSPKRNWLQSNLKVVEYEAFYHSGSPQFLRGSSLEELHTSPQNWRQHKIKLHPDE